MSGVLSSISISPLGSVIADAALSWESPVYNSIGYRGGSFVLFIAGIFGSVFPGFTPLLAISNDGTNWTSSATLWPTPISAPGIYTIWPNDLGAFFKIVYLLNSGGGAGTIASVTYELIASLKDS